MAREIAVSLRALICVSAVILAMLVPAVAADDLSSVFDPPLSEKEKAMYQKIANNPREVQKFIATRVFLRKVAVFTSKLPKGVEFSPPKYGSPQPPPDADFAYAVTKTEQVALFSSCLLCGGCGDKEDNKATGHANCGLTHPKVPDCGKPVDKNAVLSQLGNPSPEEIKLFDKANACPGPEVPKFLATRRYMRVVNAMKAKLPAGQKFDPKSAPPVPELWDTSYAVGTDEQLTLFAITLHQATDVAVKDAKSGK